MKKNVIMSDNAPAAVGPYSQAIQVGDFLYTAGQTGTDPTTGELVEGGVAAQAEQAIKNVEAVLAAAGATLDNVVKCGVFLKRMSDFAAMNEVYASLFGENRPARTTVAVAALPKSALFEIDTVAYLPQAVEKKEKKKEKKGKGKEAKKGKKEPKSD
jgi:2-iminobutanoate/2-iminopropanoate deaminase